MLFDLRARGRRRTVKVVYSGLAVLLFIGLVFLGVGSVGGGSFLENAGREGGGGGKSFAARTAAAKKRVKKSPNDPAAWAALTEAQLREAGSGENYTSTTETYTAQGKQQLAKAAKSWNRYLQLAGRHPSVKLARLMTSLAFSPTGLNDPLSALRALQIEIAGSPPSASLYSQLTQYAYLTGNFKLGDSAMKKMLALLPKTKRPLAQAELEKFKKAIEKRIRSAHVSTSSLSTTSTSSTAAAKSSSTGAATKPSTAATKKK